jgi:hypothetical protein
LEKFSGFFEKRATFGVSGFVASFGEELEGFALGVGKVLRYFHGDADVEVASSTS